MCSYARPAGYKYTAVTAYPLPAKYNIHRMSLYINNTHIGSVFAPFSASVTWSDLSASEFYTTTTGDSMGSSIPTNVSEVGDANGIGSGTTPEVGSGGQQTGGNRGTGTPETPGVLPVGIPKVYYYDYSGNLRYVACCQPA